MCLAFRPFVWAFPLDPVAPARSRVLAPARSRRPPSGSPARRGHVASHACPRPAATLASARERARTLRKKSSRALRRAHRASRAGTRARTANAANVDPRAHRVAFERAGTVISCRTRARATARTGRRRSRRMQMKSTHRTVPTHARRQARSSVRRAMGARLDTRAGRL